ncbi:MAG TPA: hypothetical protein GX707_10215 [Epulopiscium sp.]|nr:hypothetical protein [Candidatus Epulonipiscium sp.]
MSPLYLGLKTENGMKVEDRKPRNRGGKSKKSGVNRDQIAIIATQDRNSLFDLSMATLGRITKADIENAIGQCIKKEKTILCNDSHHSYKSFARKQKWNSIP